LLAAGASIKAAARKFAIDYHALCRHWRNHVSAEARADYIAGAGASKDQRARSTIAPPGRPSVWCQWATRRAASFMVAAIMYSMP
jgi:hypothetical protein